MTAKQWLQRAYNIDKEVRSKRELIEMWRGLASNLISNYGNIFNIGGDIIWKD